MNTTTHPRKPAATIPTLKGEVQMPAEGDSTILRIGRTDYTLTTQTVAPTMRGTLTGPRGAVYGILEYLDQSSLPENVAGTFLIGGKQGFRVDPLGAIGLVIVTDPEGLRIGYTGDPYGREGPPPPPTTTGGRHARPDVPQRWPRPV